MRLRYLLALIFLGPLSASANEWVMGNVTIVEDYTAYNAQFGVLVTLANQTAALSNCSQRFRIVVGQEGVTHRSLKFGGKSQIALSSGHG